MCMSCNSLFFSWIDLYVHPFSRCRLCSWCLAIVIWVPTLLFCLILEEWRKGNTGDNAQSKVWSYELGSSNWSPCVLSPLWLQEERRLTNVMWSGGMPCSSIFLNLSTTCTPCPFCCSAVIMVVHDITHKRSSAISNCWSASPNLPHFEYMVISELATPSLSKNPAVFVTEACMLAPRAHDTIHVDACNAVA